MELFRTLIEYAAFVIEVLAVAVLLVSGLIYFRSVERTFADIV